MGTQAIAPAPQHMHALAKANRVRLARAELKRRVGGGETTVADVIALVPWEAETMTIADLLMAQHRWGRSRCRRFLTSLPLSYTMGESRQIGSMTRRQRAELVRRLTVEAGRGLYLTSEQRAELEAAAVAAAERVL